MTSAESPAACLTCVDRRTLLNGSVALLGAGSALGAAAGTAEAVPSRWVSVCQVDDVPLGDGLFFSMYGQPWVVTQPRDGVFRAFSARCTHQGGICNDVIRHAIQCPNHGSRYNLRSGRVVRGPATQGLTTKQVRVRGTQVQVQF